jgi:hypothetical protein
MLRSFAGAAWPHQTDEFARIDVEGNTAQSGNSFFAHQVGLVDVVYNNNWGGHTRLYPFQVV